MDKIRFHTDEQVERAIAEALRRRSIDITTTPEVGLLGATAEVLKDRKTLKKRASNQID